MIKLAELLFEVLLIEVCNRLNRGRPGVGFFAESDILKLESYGLTVENVINGREHWQFPYTFTLDIDGLKIDFQLNASTPRYCGRHILFMVDATQHSDITLIVLLDTLIKSLSRIDLTEEALRCIPDDLYLHPTREGLLDRLITKEAYPTGKGEIMAVIQSCIAPDTFHYMTKADFARYIHLKTRLKNKPIATEVTS